MKPIAVAALIILTLVVLNIAGTRQTSDTLPPMYPSQTLTLPGYHNAGHLDVLECSTIRTC
jgi:hypothetical protein